MNILYCSNLKSEMIGRGPGHAFEVLTNLSKLGHKIVPLNADYPRNVAEVGANRQLSLWKRVKNRLSSLRILQPFKGEISIAWYFCREIVFFLRAFVVIARQKRGFDVIYRRHCLFNSEIFLARLFNIPSVREVNGIGVDELRVAGWGDNFSLRIIDWLERFNLPKGNKIIAVTSKMKEVLQKDYGVPEDKIVVIPNGANIDLFRPMDTLEARRELNLEQNDYYICFVGTIWSPQGIEHLIRSMPSILRKCPNSPLLIVGDGTIKEELVKLAQRVGVSNKVIFTGMVLYRKVPLYINASDICVLPATRELNERIGSSALKLCEYMACGKPVVASRFSGFEMIEDNETGILVQPEDPPELATAIVRLLQDEELRKEMGKNGRRYVVENRSWESVAKRTAEACEEVLKRRKRRGAHA